MNNGSADQVNGGSVTKPVDMEEITWSVLPARDRPGVAAAVLFVVILLGALVGVFVGDWIWGALSVLFLLVTLSRFFLRSRLAISREGIRAEFPLRTRQLAWSSVMWVRYDDLAALVRSRRRSFFLGREFTMLFGSHGPAVVEALQRLAPAGVASRRDGEETPSCDA